MTRAISRPRTPRAGIHRTPVRCAIAVRRRVERRSDTVPAADEVPASRARSCRRRRLRTTAGPMARPSAYATLGGIAAGSGMYVHHSTPARVRRPSWAKRVNALRSRMRQIKPTGYAGPWRDVPSARLARRGCSSGGGSRASWRGDDCSVGRCASRNPPRPRTHGEQHFRWQVRILERNAATSRLTRPIDKARAVHRRIATDRPTSLAGHH